MTLTCLELACEAIRTLQHSPHLLGGEGASPHLWGGGGAFSLDNLQIISAARIAAQRFPQLDPAQPVLLTGLADPSLAQQVQQALLAAYPPDHEVTLFMGDSARAFSLSGLAEGVDFTPQTCLWIPPLPAPAAYEALQDVVAHLRAPDGCPWDRALTWAKLRATLLEETYELLAALDADDAAKVAEEQGDLLLQIAMQVQIATEEGRYRLPDVIRGIVGKLIRRHPHVFGDAQVSGAAEVLANWEAIKRAERESNGEKRSPLAGVPKGLPALAQADAYMDRMSRLGEVPAPAAPWAELAALPADAAVTPEMVGEALFGLVAWARARGVDAERALREANARYAARFE